MELVSPLKGNWKTFKSSSVTKYRARVSVCGSQLSAFAPTFWAAGETAWGHQIPLPFWWTFKEAAHLYGEIFMEETYELLQKCP